MKRRAQQQGESEALLLPVVQDLPGLFYRCDPDGGLVFVNDACCAFFGQTREQLIGRDFFELIPAAERGAVRDRLHRLDAGESALSQEHAVIASDGCARRLRWRNRAIRDAHGGVVALQGYGESVSGRGPAEPELIECNRRLSALTANLPGMAYRCCNDPDWTMQYVSEGCEALTGYPAVDLLHNRAISYEQVIHPDDRERVRAQVQAGLASGGCYDLDYRLVTAGGDEKWVWEHGNAVCAEDGELLALEGVIFDNDARKRVEARLQENEEKYRAMFDNAPLAYQSLDENGIIIDVNPMWLNILGYHRDDVIGVSFAEFLHPDWQACFTERFEEFKRKVCVHDVHFRLKHRQGHYIDVLFEGCIGYTAAGEFRQTYCVFQDITGRIVAENLLAQSESRFRAFFDNAGVGIVEIEIDGGRYVRANQCFREMLGYSNEELAGMDMWSITREEDLQTQLDNIARLKTGELDGFSMEKICTRKDGSPIWINLTMTPLWAPGETPARCLGIVENIDARKHAEESARSAIEDKSLMLAKADEVQRALLSVIEDERQAQQALMKSQESYRSVVNTVKEVIFQTDTHGRWLFLNPAWTEVTGYSVAESLGTPFLDYAHPDERPRLEALYGQLLGREREDIRVEVRYLHKTGDVRWIEAYVRATVDGNGEVLGIAGTLNDITERKLMEERLRKLAQAVEQSPESIVITNLDAEVEYANVAFLRTTGYDMDEVIGVNPRILRSGKTPRKTYTQMWEALSQGKQWKGEFVNRRKNGDEYVEFARIAPLRQPDGTISHYVAVKEDITEKKRLASELDNHRHHLEELVQRRTVELAEARQRAEEANKAKSAFLANMSHEIRTPMNAIIGLTHLLQRAGPTPDQSERLRKVDAAAGHLLAIINDILDISKIEAGKLVLETSDFHLDAIFDHIQSLLREQARDKGLIIEIERNAVPQWLRGDPTRLRQALLNYAANAIKFTEQGAIQLRSKLLVSDGDELLVRFEVQDTGIGIEPDKLSHLFQVFEQADASTTRKHGGTGLGLAITKHLAELMGGDAGADSIPGRGSTFWFTAKLQRGRGIEPALAPALTTDAETMLRICCSGSRILLAEDNAINREVAMELLSGAGMDVVTAENGREAVEMVRAGEYDLVLMDVQMPEMDGIEATQVIRAMDDKNAIPVLAMTANIFEDDRRACSEAGMNDFVAKPVNPDDLYLTLIKWLPRSLQAGASAAKTTGSGSGSRFASELNADTSGLNKLTPAPEKTALDERFAAIDGMDTAAGLRNVRGDTDVYLRLLRQFDAGHGEDMAAVAERLDGGEIDVAVRLAHTIKGAAGTLGLIGVQQAAKALELHLRQRGADDAAAAGRLMAAVQAGQRQLHEALARLPERAGPAVAADPAAARTALDRLSPLLASDDTMANNVYREAEMLLLATHGKAAQRLGEQIARFDYPAALKTLDSLPGSGADADELVPDDIAKPAVTHGDSPIDRQALTDMFGSDSARHLGYLQKFMPHAEAVCAEIDTSYAARDAEQLAFFAHKLKSSARTVGANPLADLCEALESAGRNADWSGIDSRFPALARLMQQLRAYIDEQ